MILLKAIALAILIVFILVLPLIPCFYYNVPAEVSSIFLVFWFGMIGLVTLIYKELQRRG